MARNLSIPLVSALLIGIPVFWAFPEGLSVWRSLAIVSGWTCCGLLLASLLFIIREPWLANRLGGLERMYAWHHRLGLAAYIVVLVHPLALAIDAWEERPSLAWSTLAPWEQGWPGWLGWASLLCMMVGLAAALASSIRYSSWRWLHGLLSVSVILGAGHLLLLGVNYSLLWTPLVAIGFIFWRVVRADFGMAAKPYVVSQILRPAKDIVEIVLKPLSQSIEARPGQFVLAAFYDSQNFRGCKEFHPFTISGLASNGELSLGIKSLGDCTHHLQSIECGGSARIQGPFGTFLANQTAGPSLWIAGGIGITPFLALLRTRSITQPVQLVYLYRTEQDAAYLDELRAFAISQSLLKLTAKECGDQAPELFEIIPNARELSGLECYLCGPPELVTAAVSLLLARGVSAEKIHFERFDFR
jgi:predicted ferric reductase